MMAGAKTSNRSRYTSAGYSEREERELYISAAPAGSAQDNLRDFNRPGYRVVRPWNEVSPQPAFAEEAVAAPARQVGRSKTKKNKGIFEYIAYHARRDRQGVVLCVVLLCSILMMIAAWGGEMVDGVALSRDIAMYQNQTHAIETENESLMRQLELASGGERIRNLAQNELGMLRPERAEQQTIYIRVPEHVSSDASLQNNGAQMELLDVMLGLLDVFHIGE